MLFSVGGCRTSASGKGSHRRRRVRIHAKHSYLRSLFFSFRLSTSFWLLLNGPGGVCCCCGCGAYQMFDFLFFEFFSFGRVCWCASCHKCVCVCCFFTFFNFTRDEEQKTFLLLVRILLLFFHRRHRHHHPRDMLLFDAELCERVLSPRSCSSRFRERRFGQSESEQFNIHEIALAERLLHGLTFL